MPQVQSGFSDSITIQVGEDFKLDVSGSCNVTLDGATTALTNTTAIYGDYTAQKTLQITNVSGLVNYEKITDSKAYLLQSINPATDTVNRAINPDGTDASIGGIAAVALTSTRSTTTSDDQRILGNSTSSNYTVTIAVNTIPNGLILQQLSTGTVTVAAGAGVTFIGATLATSSAGQVISILPTPTANTFIVKVA